jgi:antirestriction protein ArdC
MEVTTEMATTRKRRKRSIVLGEGRVYGTSTAKKREYSEGEKLAWREKKQAEADSALGDILGMFETGELPDAIAQTMIARAEGVSPAVNWSLANQLLMIRAGTTDARGFHQWKSVGRSVKKGARAFRIFAPRMVKKTEIDAAGLEQDRRVLVGYTLIPVFRLQDTEGVALTDPFDVRSAELPPLFDVAERLGCTVDYLPSHQLANYRGLYSPGDHEITLLTTDERTWFHELAHAAHDVTLQARGKRLADVSEAEAEIVAEVVAATLCHLYDRDGYLWAGFEYVKRYAGDGDPARAAMRVLGDVQKCLYLILDPPELQAASAGTDTRELVAA